MIKKMRAFDRNYNLDIINQVRNLEKRSLDEYIEKVIIPLQSENSNFYETLYKDINYIIVGVDDQTIKDIVIENGDLVIEDGDFKLEAPYTRLEQLSIWLHQMIMGKILSDPMMITWVNDIGAKFEERISSYDYTPDYLGKLNDIIKLEKQRIINNTNIKITPAIRDWMNSPNIKIEKK